MICLLGFAHGLTAAEIKFGLANAPVTLDPRFATDATSSRINHLLYQQLVEFDRQLKPVPALTTWQKLNPKHYRFLLRTPTRIFHDGQRMSAEDVKATYDFILDPIHASPHRALLSLIERIDIPEKDTIDFYLHNADALFPGYLVIGILPAQLMATEHPFNRKPIGSGEFRFLQWSGVNQLILQRDRDGLRIRFLPVADPTVRALKIMRGEIDMLQNDMPPEILHHLSQQADLSLQRHRGSNFTYLGFNLRDPLTAQLPLRQAIAHAIDRDAIIRYLFADAARPASALLPPDHWAGHADLPTLAYNPDQARRLLEGLGYSRQRPLSLSYKTSSDPFRLRIATIIQHQLAAVGIDLNIQSYDWGTFYADIKAGNFQLYSLSWVGVKTPDIFRTIFHSRSVPPFGANRGFYVDDRIDTLLDQVQTQTEPDEQTEIYRSIQSRLLSQLPYVPLWYEDHQAVVRHSVKDYRLDLEGSYDGLRNIMLRIEKGS